MSPFRLAAVAVFLIFSIPAHASITESNVQKIEPFANGAHFGTTGAYKQIWGLAKGELDLAGPRNKVIVNIDKAPRNSVCRVEYEVEYFMLRPGDAQDSERHGDEITSSTQYLARDTRRADEQDARPVGRNAPPKLRNGVTRKINDSG